MTCVPEGFLALWWYCTRPERRCVVVWQPTAAASSGPAEADDHTFATLGRFSCPCCGADFNRYGARVFGPAPRPLDRFPVRVEQGVVRVETGRQRVLLRQQASRADATPG